MHSTPIVVFLALVSSGACGLRPPTPPLEAEPLTSFSRFVELAEAGDAQSQNLVGFMLFVGELTPRRPPEARRWFESAAAQGQVSAQLNLAMMYYLGIGAPQDRETADRYFELALETASTLEQGSSAPTLPRTLSPLMGSLIYQSCARQEREVTEGEQTFVTFCAGCHGLNGIAAYIGAPSFALGERMEKSDAELMRSVVAGHTLMPAWGDKLPPRFLTSALRFVRRLEVDFRGGILHPVRKAPPRHFLFGPMVGDSIAYTAGGSPEGAAEDEFTTELCVG